MLSNTERLDDIDEPLKKDDIKILHYFVYIKNKTLKF